MSQQQHIPTANRAGRGVYRRLLLFTGMLGLLVFSGTAVLALHLRDRAFEAAGRELRNLSATLADQAERAFQGVELVQAGIIDHLEHKGVDSPAAFRAAMTGFDIHEDLRHRISGLPQIDAITAIDAEGKLLNFTRYWPIPPVNIADRDYFKVLKQDGSPMTFIGEPVPNRGTGTWTIYLARKVTAGDGRFLGLILGAIELAYFERLYGSVAPGPDSSIALFRRDGILLARHPHLDSAIGQPLATSARFRQLQDEGIQRALFRLTSLADGQDRLIAAHATARYPLVVNAALTVESILADWRKQAIALSGAAVLLMLTAAGAVLALARQFRGRELLAEANAALDLARERERAERLAREQDARFAAALANMPEGVIMLDGAGRLLAANASYVAMYALPPELAGVGTPIQAIHAHLATVCSDQDAALPWRSDGQADPTIPGPAREVRCLRDGRIIEISRRTMPQGGWVSTHEDVTERRAAEARIAHMAHHDALTGLPNRVLLRSRLAEALARAGRGEPCAVLCLDLDRFKEVNDTLGHPAGDALLRAVTQRLKAELRETDTVARLGGDEFAIIQSAADQVTDATALARRLVRALAQPFDLDGNQVVIGTSIGIALAPADGKDPDKLLKAADLALYRAKEKGRGGWHFFEPEMDARMQARRALEMDLRRALAAEEFDLYYQPVLDLRSGRVMGFEALVRWQHAERGTVPPGDFVPLAEETGLIIPLGAWVLQRACKDAATWPDDLKVSVNLSPVQLSGSGPVRAVAAALAASGLPASRLELEITETAMIADTDATLAVLGKLKALGVSIAMDDFGTGYSSLSYLRKFPFDRVKIDRSFVRDLDQCANSMAIVQAVTGLCHAMGMATTAEGVETAAQLSALTPESGMQVQGYLFSAPRPAEDLPAMYRRLNAGAETD